MGHQRQKNIASDACNYLAPSKKFRKIMINRQLITQCFLTCAPRQKALDDFVQKGELSKGHFGTKQQLWKTALTARLIDRLK